MTDDEILSDVFDEEHPGAEEDTDDDTSNESTCSQPYDIHQALELLREYMLFSENGACIHKYINLISRVVEEELSTKLTQTDIRNYFQ